uniref:NADH-ubiquinone oxidoreductase chain 5 n=1 Tax=Desmopachria sp. RRMO-2020 TaxID=2781576 RepID=A0A873QKC5_9DYTI|nr:NADH dehydrogenase subunit 5 [Desmopachria sp. RRMO-2020]QPA36204.1 NADH dehydrogenase subunit 5 [Desmopachria sp. RRMO-2020]QPA36217.1 NADH dehydrogenase subunit 5 [Desmopachria sp. RRMO-2020]QPA36230.1 NADH dehydrogenase subunit 5 [Desmopachria sp. RRMO-2020]
MINKISICLISSCMLLIFSIMSFIFSLEYIIMDYVMIIEFELLSLNSNSIVMSLLFDWMSLLFMSFVLFISSMVIFYSKDYMEGDEMINRFIMLVLMFVFSMMLLIISPNLISILLGWDGLGLVSYCLVIYYQNFKSYNAGMITALMNRIGDVMLLMAITWMLNYGSWNYYYYMDFMVSDVYMQNIALLVMLAAMTKSAQIPFSSWLPAAMAAPTPVSALVHSSTLVTAGVYLLIRFNSILSDYMSMYLLIIGILTMFMSGLGANFEFDLKKIIALSTLSQLGLMMSILAMGNYKLAFFHLLTHAMFKALLFMCAGSVIHSLKNVQDIRFMGNLMEFMPLTCISLNISSLALCGMPFLAGFYSKDLILEMVSMSSINLMLYFLFYFSTGLTVSYSFRLCYYLITGSFNFYSLYSLMDYSWVMMKSKIMMLIFVILSGSLLSWLIFPTPMVVILPIWMKMMVLIVCILGGWLGYEISKFSISWVSKSLKYYNYVYFMGFMWFLPNISTFFINMMPLSMSYNLFKSFDQGWNEYFGGQGIYKNMKNNSILFQFFQDNSIKIFFLLLIFWLIFLLLIFYLNSL